MAINPMLGLVVAFVLLSGIFVAGISSFDAFAAKENNNGDKGCSNSQGKGNGNAQSCARSPNGNSNGGIPSSNTCDGSIDGTDPDGVITVSELPENFDQTLIDTVEDIIYTGTGANGVIDTAEEFSLMEDIVGDICG